MKRAIITLSLFILTSLFGEEESLSLLLKRADEAFAATLYETALPLYTEAELQLTRYLLEGETLDRIRSRIGSAHFYLHRDTDAAAWLALAAPDCTNLMLLAACRKHLGLYEEALSTLQHPSLKNSRKDEVAFESGTVFYLSGQPSEAKKHFLMLVDKTEKPHLQLMAHLYLARIEIEEKNIPEAEQHLAVLSTLNPQSDELAFEIAYLSGEVSFQKQDYISAVARFTDALPKKRMEQAPWYIPTLYRLGRSRLMLANSRQVSADVQKQSLIDAEKTFDLLSRFVEDEQVYLALAEALIEQASRFKESTAWDKADAILGNSSRFTTLEGQTHALLLRAETASTYEARNRLYLELTKPENASSPFYSKGWYLRGINEFDEAVSLRKFAPERANILFFASADAFEKAFYLLKNSEPRLASLAVRFQAEALWHTNQTKAKISAFHVLNELIRSHASVLEEHGTPEDFYALRDRYAVLLAQEDEIADDFPSLAEKAILETLTRFPEGTQTDASLHLLGTHYFHQGKYARAEPVFASLAKQFPDSPLAPEALLSAGYCAEKQKKDRETIRSYRRLIVENYPSCQTAPLAYFLHYSFQEYLQGDRASIKHLHNFKQHFPDSPYLINARYLIGLDYKRDRKTHEGKWIRKKNYNDAIEAFSEAEETFDQLHSKRIIPKEDLAYFVQIRYRSMLDRALVNYAVAEESEGTKRDIYLEYAIELFQRIHRELEFFQHPLASMITKGETFAPIHEECCFWLAQTQVKAANEEAAKQTLAYMLEKYKAGDIADGYYLSRAYYEQGMLAMKQNDYEQAWRSLMQAEAAAKEKYLSADQKLDLWIQQSLCYKALNQMDQAMLILSKVINNDAASGLRLKAMYMRAEIYELQGRFELARKQLEATSKKGGEWSLKAKQKLEADYGYE